MSHKRTAKFVTSTCNTTTIAGIAKKQKLSKLIDGQAAADLGRIAFPPSVCAPITHITRTPHGDGRPPTPYCGTCQHHLVHRFQAHAGRNI